MRVKEITVNGLFGVFNHTIPMKLDDRITIIMGPNGFGKTVLLQMINALFTLHFHQLRVTPFSQLRVEFDNNTSIMVSRNQSDAGVSLDFDLTINSNQKEHFALKPLERPGHDAPIRLIEREADLQQVGPDTWVDIRTGKELTLDEVLRQYKDLLPPSYRKLSITEPKWLQQVKDSVHIRLIETQRLLTFSPSRRRPQFEGHPQMIASVITYSEELSNAIQSKLAEYAALSQSLDRTFPSRLVRGGPASDSTTEYLQKKLDDLEHKRARLIEAGLLDKGEEIDFVDLRWTDETNRNVLSVYIQDVEKKLSILDEMSDKLDLFKKIINGRFLYKQMSISKKQGFIFTNSLGQSLSPINLSSGEQHELVLLYELLFKVQPNSLILIDEPELSLHAVWQQQFLRDLTEITSLANLDVLIATHSPLIIHDRDDLTVELKGPAI